MIGVVDLQPVGVLRIERTVCAVANAAFGRFKFASTLRLCQVLYRPFRLQELNALGLPLDELIQEVIERVPPGEQAKFAVYLSLLVKADDR